MNVSDKSNKQKYVFAIIVFVISLSYCLIIGMNKEISFCDEVYTYESANLPGKSNVFHSLNTWVTGKDIEWYLSAQGYNPHFGEINKYLWEDHVPMYFWCIRIMSILFRGSCSPMIGIGVNAITFSIFSFWLAMRMCQIFIKWSQVDEAKSKISRRYVLLLTFIILGLFLWMQKVTFRVLFTIRPYIFLLVFGIMALVEYVIFLFTSYENSQKDRKRITCYMVWLTLIVTCGLLSHYHFWILLFVCGIITWMICLCKRQWSKAIGLTIHVLCSVAITTCLFPQWIHNVFAYKAIDSKDGLLCLENWSSGIIKALNMLTVDIYPFEKLSGNLVWIFNVLLFVATICIMVKREHYQYLKAVLILYIEIVLYTIIVTVSVTYIEFDRYFWPSRAMFALLMYVIIGYVVLNVGILLAKKREDEIAPDLIKQCIIKFRPYIVSIVLLPIVFGGGSMISSKDNLNTLHGTGNEVLMESIADIPWIVYTEGFHYIGYSSAYDLMHAKNICFTLNFPEYMDYDLYLPNDKEVILFTEDVFFEDALVYFEKMTQKEVNYKQIGTSVGLNIYHLEFGTT